MTKRRSRAAVEPPLPDGMALVVLTVCLRLDDSEARIDVDGNLTLLGDNAILAVLERSRDELDRVGHAFFDAVTQALPAATPTVPRARTVGRA